MDAGREERSEARRRVSEAYGAGSPPGPATA
jgi:hypothetical protein